MKIQSVSFASEAVNKSRPAAESVERDRGAKASVSVDSGDSKKTQPEELLNKIKGLTQDGVYSVSFELNEATDDLVIQLIDSESGETIRQIPSEELISAAEHLRNLRGNLVDSSS